jgi:hypothetical protein
VGPAWEGCWGVGGNGTYKTDGTYGADGQWGVAICLWAKSRERAKRDALRAAGSGEIAAGVNQLAGDPFACIAGEEYD